MNPNLPRPSLFLRAAGAGALVSCTLALAATISPLPEHPPADRPLDPPSMPSAPMPSRPAEDFLAVTRDREPTRATQRVIANVSVASGESARLSIIATEKAAHAEVRSFADQVSSSSRALEQEIDQLAINRNLNVPTGKEAEEVADWRDKKTDEFDEDYIARTVKLHRDTIKSFENYLEDGDKDPELAAIAQKHLPGLREHLRQAESLRQRVD